MKKPLKIIGIVYILLGSIFTLLLPFSMSGGNGELAFIYFIIFGFTFSVIITILYTYIEMLENQEKILERLQNLESFKVGIKKEELPKDVETVKDEKMTKESVVGLTVKHLLKDKWYQDGPIILRTMDLYLSSTEARLKLRIKNISDQEISGIKILIKTWNLFHEVIDTNFSYIYKDVDTLPGNSFGDDIYINLPSAQTGFVDVEVQKVLFSSGSQWEGSEKTLIDLPELEKFRPDDYLYDLLRLETGKEIFDYLQKVPFKEDDFFTDQVLPRLEEIVKLEQSQGNQKTNVIVLLKGLYKK